MLFNSGKYEALIKIIEGTSTILTTHNTSSTTPQTLQVTAGSSSSTTTTSSRSTTIPSGGVTAAAAAARDSARKLSDDLIWSGSGVSVLQWLVVALEKVEMQFKGIGLGLLMQRCGGSNLG